MWFGKEAKAVAVGLCCGILAWLNKRSNWVAVSLAGDTTTRHGLKLRNGMSNRIDRPGRNRNNLTQTHTHTHNFFNRLIFDWVWPFGMRDKRGKSHLSPQTDLNPRHHHPALCLANRKQWLISSVFCCKHSNNNNNMSMAQINAERPHARRHSATTLHLTITQIHHQAQETFRPNRNTCATQRQMVCCVKCTTGCTIQLFLSI